jgi:3-oxoacyl-[acyl-carrier protein] reductase
MRFRGKRALVTASSSGIGRGVAERLAREGAELFLSGMEIDLLPEAAAQIRAEHNVVVHHQLSDFTQPGAGERLGETAVEVMGGVDILFSNTGSPQPGKFLDLSLSQWEVAYRLLLESAVGLTRAVLPGMVEARWGRLIYSTSSSVVHPMPKLHLSNVLRSSVLALARSLAHEIGPDGVTTHVIAPGSIETARRQQLVAYRAKAENRSAEEVDAEELKHLPVGRFGTVEDVGAVVAFLASDEAGYLTGSTINVDGGLVYMPLL